MSCLSNWTIHAIVPALEFFFFTSSEKLLESFVFSFSKSFGKRTMSCPIQSVIILVNEQIGPQLRSCLILFNQLSELNSTQSYYHYKSF